MLRAKLLLEARGVEVTERSLAGAMLEAERDALMVAFIMGFAKKK